MILASASDVPTERDPFERGPEVESMGVAGEFPSRIRREEIDFIARGAEREARGQVGGSVKLTLVERAVAVGRNAGPIRNPELLRIAEVVRQIPVADVSRSTGEIAQLDGIRRRRRFTVGERLIDHDLRNARRTIGCSRRSIDRTARTPTASERPRDGSGIVINDDQREAEAVGDRMPLVVIAEVEDRFAQSTLQDKAVAIIGEVAGVNAHHGSSRTRVTGVEGKLVLHHDHSLARRQHAIGEREINPTTERVAVHIERSRADVPHFDILEVFIDVRAAEAGRLRMIHDLGDDQLGGFHDEGADGRRAP